MRLTLALQINQLTSKGSVPKGRHFPFEAVTAAKEPSLIICPVKIHFVLGFSAKHMISESPWAYSMKKQASQLLVLGHPVQLILGVTHFGGGACSGLSEAISGINGACPGFSVAISGGGSLSDGGSMTISVAPLQKTHGGRLPTPFSSTSQDPLHLSLDNET